jgi:hypothetical protein
MANVTSSRCTVNDRRDQPLAANTAMAEIVKAALEFHCGKWSQKKDLLVVARELCNMLELKVDRQALRNGDGLICWFCENWGTIDPNLRRLKSQSPRGYDTRHG